MIGIDELRKRFTHHPPKEDQPKRYKAIRQQTRDIAELIEDMCPDSREKSLAMIKLEEAVFWANASIARNE